MIRLADAHDIDVMMRLGMDMHQESRYKEMEFSVEVFLVTIEYCIESEDGFALVFDDDGAINGMALGTAYNHFFTKEKIATDLLLYVTSDCRGSGIGYNLAQELILWGRSVASEIQVGITADINNDSAIGLYESLGLTKCGVIFKG